MPETKETLSIKAQFDASQLKGEAKKALSDLGNETKKLQRDFKSMGNSANDGLRSVERQADHTANAVKNIGKEAKTAADQLNKINVKQGVGMALGAVGQVGSMVSDMSGNSTAGAALGGSLQGMAVGGQIGMALGPVAGALGAAAGGLAGAAKALLEAAAAQMDAEVAENDRIDRESRQYLDEYNARKEAEFIQNEAASKIGGATSVEELQKVFNEQEAAIKELQSSYDAKLDDFQTNKEALGATGEDLDALNKTRSAKLDDIKESYTQLQDNVAILNEIQKKLNAAKQEELAKKQEELAKEKEANRIKEIEQKNAEKVAQEAARAAEKTKKDQWEANKRATLDSLKSQMEVEQANLNEQEGLISDYSSRANSFRITDSLTQIGGTSGYGGINESVQSSLSKIVDNVKAMAKDTAAILEKLNNSYASTQGMVWA